MKNADYSFKNVDDCVMENREFEDQKYSTMKIMYLMEILSEIWKFVRYVPRISKSI